MRIGKCKGCGAPLVWIETAGGKAMPCDPDPIVYAERIGGSKKIVTPNGVVISCDYAADSSKATGLGYAPHWGSCPAASSFKRRG